jgi:hypothetical protein
MKMEGQGQPAEYQSSQLNTKLNTIMSYRILKYCLLAALFVCVGSLARADYAEDARQALRLVGVDIQAALAKSGLPTDQPWRILPIKGDASGYGHGRSQNSCHWCRSPLR